MSQSETVIIGVEGLREYEAQGYKAVLFEHPKTIGELGFVFMFVVHQPGVRDNVLHVLAQVQVPPGSSPWRMGSGRPPVDPIPTLNVLQSNVASGAIHWETTVLSESREWLDPEHFAATALGVARDQLGVVLREVKSVDHSGRAPSGQGIPLRGWWARLLSWFGIR